MPRVKANPVILHALVRMYKLMMPTETQRDLEPLARRALRGRAGDDRQLAAIYRAELARLWLRERWITYDEQGKPREVIRDVIELDDNRKQQRFIGAALRRVERRIRDMKLSPKQREVLERARDGEDRQVPAVVGPGTRRWYVPAGYVVPEGSAEHQACRTLANRGLLDRGRHVPISPDNPHGLGGYGITAKGRRALGGTR